MRGASTLSTAHAEWSSCKGIITGRPAFTGASWPYLSPVFNEKVRDKHHADIRAVVVYDRHPFPQALESAAVVRREDQQNPRRSPEVAGRDGLKALLPGRVPYLKSTRRSP
jgi:hypothetical protein